MSKRLTLEFVSREFKRGGCTLLATHYTSNSVKMPYICKCGNRSEISYSKFKHGRRCYSCRNQKLADLFRHDFNYVQEYFTKQGCQLLATEYTNSKIPLSYICKCGNRDTVRFNNFKNNGARCRKCKIEKISKARRLNSSMVKRFYKLQGCILIDEYKNARKPLAFMCNCGEPSKTPFHHFKKGVRCKNCGVIRTVNAKKQYDLFIVQELFRIDECILLANEYINTKTHMEYVCKCGKQAKINLENFLKGRRCAGCSGKRAWKTRRIHDQLMETADIEFLSKAIKERIAEIET